MAVALPSLPWVTMTSVRLALHSALKRSSTSPTGGKICLAPGGPAGCRRGAADSNAVRMRSRIRSRLGFSAGAILLSPKFAERRAWNRWRRVVARPRARGIQCRAREPQGIQRAQRGPHNAANELEPPRPGHCPAPQFEPQALAEPSPPRIYGVAPVVQQVVVQVHLYRANVRARPAQRR